MTFDRRLRERFEDLVNEMAQHATDEEWLIAIAKFRRVVPKNLKDELTRDNKAGVA